MGHEERARRQEREWDQKVRRETRPLIEEIREIHRQFMAEEITQEQRRELLNALVPGLGEVNVPETRPRPDGGLKKYKVTQTLRSVLFSPEK